jgi:hypothetical protein
VLIETFRCHPPPPRTRCGYQFGHNRGVYTFPICVLIETFRCHPAPPRTRCECKLGHTQGLYTFPRCVLIEAFRCHPAPPRTRCGCKLGHTQELYTFQHACLLKHLDVIRLLHELGADIALDQSVSHLLSQRYPTSDVDLRRVSLVLHSDDRPCRARVTGRPCDIAASMHSLMDHLLGSTSALPLLIRDEALCTCLSRVWILCTSDPCLLSLEHRARSLVYRLCVRIHRRQLCSPLLRGGSGNECALVCLSPCSVSPGERADADDRSECVIERGEWLAPLLSLVSDAACVRDVLNLRLTCRSSLYERRFSGFSRSHACAVERDLVEQYVGGEVSRFVSIGDLNLALHGIHRGGAGV